MASYELSDTSFEMLQYLLTTTLREAKQSSKYVSIFCLLSRHTKYFKEKFSLFDDHNARFGVLLSCWTRICQGNITIFKLIEMHSNLTYFIVLLFI
jgi:hypothetical protein